LDAQAEVQLGRIHHAAAGRLDYGNSPRATPNITDRAIYVQGPFGHLLAFDPLEGNIVWRLHLEYELNGKRPTWGFCASPLLHEGRLIVQPGGHATCIAALDPRTGDALWISPARPAAYASPTILLPADTTGARARPSNGESLIIGFDERSMGAWSVIDGQRLWEYTPENQGEFFVPSPVVYRGSVLVIAENNAARMRD
jgi:outer membrane protein assembly factor BamB